MQQETTSNELTDLHELMQALSNQHNAVITVVIDRKHFCYTPKDVISLSDVVMCSEFLNEGE